jgi:hypothetical protein
MTQQAFVVQFRPETDVERGRYVGRVEHIASGRAAQFNSSRALLAFMRQILARAESTEEGAHMKDPYA